LLGTTRQFLDDLGLKALDELPELESQEAVVALAGLEFEEIPADESETGDGRPEHAGLELTEPQLSEPEQLGTEPEQVGPKEPGTEGGEPVSVQNGIDAQESSETEKIETEYLKEND